MVLVITCDCWVGCLRCRFVLTTLGVGFACRCWVAHVFGVLVFGLVFGLTLMLVLFGNLLILVFGFMCFGVFCGFCFVLGFGWCL